MAPFFVKEDSHLLSCAREEIGMLIKGLLKILPEATILLTGSLSVGEGRYVSSHGQRVIQSD